MKSLFPLPVLLMTALLASGGAVAQSLQTDTVILPPGVEIRTEGQLVIPKGATQSAWLDVYSHHDTYPPRPKPKTTNMIKKMLENVGWTWAATESGATTSISLTGYFSVYNELPGSVNTGKASIAEVYEAGITTLQDEKSQHGTQVASTASPRGLLDYDAGVAHMAGKLSGSSNALAVGAGAAIGLDYLADATGLRAALNNSFARGFASLFRGGTNGKPPFFCGEECKRQFHTYHHEANLSVRFMQGTAASPYYTVIVSKVAQEREDPTPLIEIALNRIMQDLAKGAAQ